MALSCQVVVVVVLQQGVVVVQAVAAVPLDVVVFAMVAMVAMVVPAVAKHYVVAKQVVARAFAEQAQY